MTEVERLVMMRTWNSFVVSIIRAKEHFEKLQKIRADCGSTYSKEIELMPYEAQRFLSKNFMVAQFNTMLPRLVDLWRTFGGQPETLLIPENFMKGRKNARERSKQTE